MIETTINELETTIGQIRDTINEGIQNRSDLTKDDKLKDDAPLVDYIEAITKLKANITEAGQQIIILYTYAESKAAAEKKKTPTISWKKDENEEYVIEYGEFNPSEWVTSGAIQQDPTHKLWIRFASITKDADNADFGIPIQMTGDQGPKGDQGIPGTDAVILTGVHRLVKLYCESDTKPTVPAFRKDISSNSKFKNDLDVTRIYYGDEANPTYIDEGDWTSEYTGDANAVVWEIDVDINSKGPEVKILSTPIQKHITITSTKVEYAANNSGVSAPTSGWGDSRPSMEDNSHLWSKTITTYSNGYTHEYTSLIQELPTVIKSITTTYLATQDTTPPKENAEGWSSDIPMIGPVIWKKEVTEYTAKIGGGEGEDSNIKTIITPVAIQGASGIKFIGTVTSESDLPTEALVWNEEYIGRMGMLVGADTYIWYGTSEPTPAIEGIKRIGSNYWLDMGPIHVCDWDAEEGELGYIKNKPEEKIVQLMLTTTPYQLEKYPYFIEWALSIGQDCGSSYFPIPDDVIIQYDSLNNTIQSKGPSVPVWIYYKNPWKSNLISEDIFVEEITYLELIWKVRTSQLSVGKTYKLNCLTNFSGQSYNNGHVLIKAVSTSKLDNFGIFVHNDEKVADCWWDDFNKSFIGEYNDSMINPTSVCKTNIDTYKFIVGGLSGSRYECHKNNVSIITFSPTRIVDILNNDYNPSSTTISGKNNYVRGCDSRIAFVIGDGNHISFAGFGAGTVLIFGNNHFINASISGSVDLGSIDQPINNCVVFGISSNCKITKSNTFKILDSSSVSIESGAITAKSGDFSGSVSAAGGFFKQ